MLRDDTIIALACICRPRSSLVATCTSLFRARVHRTISSYIATGDGQTPFLDGTTATSIDNICYGEVLDGSETAHHSIRGIPHNISCPIGKGMSLHRMEIGKGNEERDGGLGQHELREEEERVEPHPYRGRVHHHHVMEEDANKKWEQWREGIQTKKGIQSRKRS